MKNILDNLPENDSLENSEKKRVVDQILFENKGLPGATMVGLNELQSRIGFVSEAMQKYVALKLRVPVSSVHGLFRFIHSSPPCRVTGILSSFVWELPAMLVAPNN